jgi:glycine oxidase
MPAQEEVSHAVTDTTDVLIVGAGVIGTSVAWRLAQRAVRVTVIDPAPGTGATHAAAGMLAPVTELHYGEESLLRLNLESAARYPAFVGELETATGLDTDYRRDGTLLAAWDAADLAELRDLHALHDRLGLDSRLLTGSELREHEPGLAPGLPGGLYTAGDHCVDPGRLHRALRTAALHAGVSFRDTTARMLRTASGKVRGIETDHEAIDAGTVVLAAGAASPQLTGLPRGLVAVRPVKGQTLELGATTREPHPLRHVLRGRVRATPVYLVPRADGRVIVGASSEEAGYDLSPRAGVVHDLLRDAQALLPATAELTFVAVRTGLRPATPDNAPLIGPVDGLDGLLLATGHYRNGVLLAPVTADLIAAAVTGEPVRGDLAGFNATRFARARQGAA